MLVLTRRAGEQIVIDNNIRLTVVSVGPGRVKLGIQAPPNVRVDRQEIHDKIELSSDVLATVGVAETAGDVQNTLVTSGSDTAMIVEVAPSAVTAPPAASPVGAPATVPPLPLTNKLSKYRLPRKPR